LIPLEEHSARKIAGFWEFEEARLQQLEKVIEG
jgi:hypothetical protein